MKITNVIVKTNKMQANLPKHLIRGPVKNEKREDDMPHAQYK